jgi:hypothetical protein
MATSMTVYVGDEFVTNMLFPDNPLPFYEKIINAAKNNPTIVDITNMENYPVEGMSFQDNSFIETEELNFITNPNGSTSHTFAFIVDGVYVATQGFDAPDWLMIISAYQSNPRFEILEDIETNLF